MESAIACVLLVVICLLAWIAIAATRTAQHALDARREITAIYNDWKEDRNKNTGAFIAAISAVPVKGWSKEVSVEKTPSKPSPAKSKKAAKPKSRKRSAKK